MKKEAVQAVVRKVRETASKFNMFGKGAQIVVGFSGGPDSLCLFDVLIGLSEEMELTLIPVHVNHGLRGDASDADQRFCEEFCADRGIKLETAVIDCEEEARGMGVSTETAGRIKRYEAFGNAALRAAGTGRETVIAVAHNADDRVETVLQHILRGSGTAGLASIPYVRPMELPGGSGTVNVIRPVLSVSRREIEEYCEARGLEARRDATNEEPIYGRNRIRLGLIPELEAYSPGIKDILLRLADSAAEDDEVLRGLAEEAYAGSAVVKPGTVRIDGDAFRELMPAVAKRVLKIALAETGLTEDVTSAHYEAMMRIAAAAGPSGRIELPRGFRLEMEYGDLVLAGPAPRSGAGGTGDRMNCFPEMLVRVITPEEYELVKGSSVPDERGAKGNVRRIFFDAEELPEGEPELRTRRAGDRIRLKNGSRKLQDLFVDMKVPKRERDEVPLIAAGSEILFAGTERPRYSAAYRVTENTKKVLYIELVY